MKNWIWIAIAIGVSFTACKEQQESQEQLLPSSSGRLGEVVVITDIVSLDSNLKAVVDDVFEQPIPGFPPPGEKSFVVKYTDDTYFRGYFKTHHNIFILLTNENLERMEETYGEQNTETVRQFIAKGALGWNKQDLWAKNQNVFYITADNKAEMLEKLKRNKQEILELAYDHEGITGSNMIYVNAIEKDTFLKSSMEKRGYAIRKPTSFRVAIDDEHFVWLRKSPPNKELEYGIFLFDVPYESEAQLETEELIKIRNEFTKKYIPGEIEDSYMSYSKIFIPARRDITFKDHYCADIRGWWEVEGDFMGGPSTIKAVVDENRGRIVFVEGFIFYPNEDKSMPMRELELILNSLDL